MWSGLWKHRRRVFKLACSGACFLILGGVGFSLLVAYRLTHRAQKTFVEVVPKAPKFDVELLRLKTSDGEEIGGWYIPGEPHQPVVILIHGNGGHRATRWPQAVFLKQAGYSVLLITCRAHGDSTGSTNDVGYSARNDVVAAVRWLQAKDLNRPIVIWGASLGSAAAIFAMPDVGKDVQGLILECPYRDLETAVWQRMQYYLPPVLDRLGYLGIRIAGGIFLPHLHEISPLKGMKMIPVSVPVLILAGGADRRARPSEAEELHEQIASHSRFEIIENADHLKLWETNEVQCRATILKFLETDLRRNSAKRDQ
jgi:alpha-beta hydrolase superfamily lysophospholipase